MNSDNRGKWEGDFHGVYVDYGLSKWLFFYSIFILKKDRACTSVHRHSTCFWLS